MGISYHFIAVFTALLLLASGATAQEAPGKTSREIPPQRAEAHAGMEAVSETPAPAPSEEAVWQKALTHYELGETDAALVLLKDAVHGCRTKCKTRELGTLYASVGIVLSGGKSDHKGGVVAFRKALSLDPEITLLSLYQTAEVKAAFREAKYGTKESSAPPAPTQVPRQPQQYSRAAAAPKNWTAKSKEDLEAEKQHEIDLRKKRVILLAAGMVQGGSVQAGEGVGDGSYHAGASVTLAGMPGTTSGFTMGARAHGGIFLTDRAPAHFGLSAILGGTIGKRQDNSFGYFLGGWGFQYFPAIGEAGTALSFQGGGSIGGILIGGSIDMVANGANLNVIMIGLDIGYGGLL